MKPRRLLFKFILSMLVMALGIALFSYLKQSRPERPQPKLKEKVWNVAVIEAMPQDLSPHLTLYGETETPALLRAAAPGAGVVAEILVRKGDRVRSGQQLLVLDPRDFEPAVQQAEADVLDLQAQLNDLQLRHESNQALLAEEQRLLELAQAELARNQRLSKQNLGSDSALDAARNTLSRQELSLISRQSEIQRYAASRAQLQARLQRSQAQLAEAQLALQRSRIVAPFDGMVSAVEVAAGDRVQIAATLLSLYPVAQLEVRARIPVRYQGEIQAALTAGEVLHAEAQMAGHRVQLILDRLAGEAAPGGIDGLFRVAAGGEFLRLGNLLKLQLQRPLQHDLVAIPFHAIYGNNRIYLLKEGRMQGLTVENVGQYLPPDAPPQLLIRSAVIEPGDSIITTHLPQAVSGLKVNVLE
jgi:HlyD family secretion protein